MWLAFLAQVIREVLIWPGHILPVGRLSLMSYPEHPCFINQGCVVEQQLPPVG